MACSCFATTLRYLSVVRLQSGSLIILDLDDTLYSERDFQRSGFRAILETLDVPHTVLVDDLIELSIQGENPFDHMNFDDNLRHVALSIYRQHTPHIALYPDAQLFIEEALSVGCTLAIATEGRSITQRNKMSALGLDGKISHILISEEVGYRKVEVEFFAEIIQAANDRPCVMVGDNPVKDFFVPNSFGWATYLLLDRGNNVHTQDVKVEDAFHAQHLVHSFNEFSFTN
jgi:putative hydrolase of the HAD superfamily